MECCRFTNFRMICFWDSFEKINGTSVEFTFVETFAAISVPNRIHVLCCQVANYDAWHSFVTNICLMSIFSDICQSNTFMVPSNDWLVNWFESGLEQVPQMWYMYFSYFIQTWNIWFHKKKYATIQVSCDFDIYIITDEIMSLFMKWNRSETYLRWITILS